ncbi:hypothetical protein AVEN_184271-1 [Araneus ventricosus]|uniref:Uncharacterized protein n=1 Tax=Araneus ventricosus TaxID=182803 RepID=A0A4Y1ZV59_ARAVE|nr:hypothetical protein AVEN_184271-1 [Araneus ventricosus]
MPSNENDKEYILQPSQNKQGSGGLVGRYRFRVRKVPGSKPNSTEDPQCMWAWRTLDSTSWVKRTPDDVAQKIGKGQPAYFLSSSSDGTPPMSPCLMPLRQLNRLNGHRPRHLTAVQSYTRSVPK